MIQVADSRPYGLDFGLVEPTIRQEDGLKTTWVRGVMDSILAF